MKREEADWEGDPEGAGLELIGNNWLRGRGSERGEERGGGVGEKVGEVEEGGKESSRETEKANGPGIVAAGEHGEEEAGNCENELDEEEENIEVAGETERTVFTEIDDVVENDLSEEEGGTGGEECNGDSDFKILKTRFHWF